MNTSSQRRSAAAYTQNISAPSRNRAISVRGLIGLALAVLLPPVGIFFLWRQGVFRTRGRMLVTARSAVEMMALVVLLTPRAELSAQTPVPATPVQVTAAPVGETVTALTNIEQLLYEKQLADALAAGKTEEDLLTEQQRLEKVNAENEAIYNTIVYSVYKNAKYYHREAICGNQTNGRSLTVREALHEGLGQCRNCLPPVPTG